MANRGKPDQVRAWLTSTDAMAATIVATTQLVSTAPKRGAHTIGRAVELQPVLDRMRALGAGLEFRLEGQVDAELVELAKLAHQ